MDITLHTPRPIFAAESISTQLDGFGEKLEKLVGLLVQEILAKDTQQTTFSDKHPVIVEIQNSVKARFGLKIELITDEHLAAILPFYSNKNHIFIHDFFRGNLNIREQSKLLKSLEGKKGTVDLKNATVSGIFSEYEHPLYMNFDQLVRAHKFSASEITACMLHEIGHAYYACYYSDRADRTNQVLASVARHLMGNEETSVDYVYKELSEVTPSVTKEAVDKMLNGPRVVAGAVWFKTVVGIVKSQTQNDTYNDTAFEERADNFASRFGYGKTLVIALDKLFKYSPDKNQGIRVLVQVLTATTTIALALMIFGMLGSGAIGAALVFSVYKLIFLSTFREDVGDHTYDKLKQRYLRLRMDAIDQLKSVKLKKDKVKEILEAIYDLDVVIKETAVVKTLPSHIANFVFSGARDAEKSISDQQLMEALASNELFLHSADLRVRA